MAMPANKKRKILRSQSPNLSLKPSVLPSIGTPKGSQNGSNDEEMDINTIGDTQQQQQSNNGTNMFHVYVYIRLHSQKHLHNYPSTTFNQMYLAIKYLIIFAEYFKCIIKIFLWNYLHNSKYFFIKY